eukprot:5078320-Pyramimonas_sp.AAC.1
MPKSFKPKGTSVTFASGTARAPCVALLCPLRGISGRLETIWDRAGAILGRLSIRDRGLGSAGQWFLHEGSQPQEGWSCMQQSAR